VMNFAAEFDEAQAAAGFLAPGIESEQFNDKYNASSDSNKVPRRFRLLPQRRPERITWQLNPFWPA